LIPENMASHKLPRDTVGTLPLSERNRLGRDNAS